MNVGSRAQAALACLCAMAVSACGEQAPGEGEVRVVATTSQVADLTRNVAGDRAHVHGLLPPSADPHDYDVRPSDVAELAEADVIVRSGGELDAWLDDAIRSSGADAQPVTLMEEVGAATDEPHWFQDPRLAAAAVEAIALALARADPEGGSTYEDNARSYRGRLSRLERSARACLRRVPPRDRELVTRHDALGAYAERFGLRVVGTVVPSRSSHGSASAGDTAALVAAIRREGVPAVFPDQGSNGRVERAIADEAGARLGPPLWSDALGARGSGAETYIDALAANTTAIVEGLTGERRVCEAGD